VKIIWGSIFGMRDSRGYCFFIKSDVDKISSFFAFEEPPLPLPYNPGIAIVAEAKGETPGPCVIMPRMPDFKK